MLLSWTRNATGSAHRARLKYRLMTLAHKLSHASWNLAQAWALDVREGSLGDLHNEYPNDFRRMDSALPPTGSPGARGCGTLGRACPPEPRLDLAAGPQRAGVTAPAAQVLRPRSEIRVWPPSERPRFLPGRAAQESPLLSSLGILEGRHRLERILGRTGQNKSSIVQLELAHGHGHVMLPQAEESAGSDDGV